MPHPHTTAEICANNVTAYLTPALTLLDSLNDAFGLSYIQPIIKTTQALVMGVQTVKQNKDECFQLVESIHQILYPIIQLQTLHKIYMFIQIQQDGNRIKQFFHQAQANKLLKDCRAGLDQAIEVSSQEVTVQQGQTGVTVLSDVVQVQTEADNMHKELLELISALSDTDGTMSDRSSLVRGFTLLLTADHNPQLGALWDVQWLSKELKLILIASSETKDLPWSRIRVAAYYQGLDPGNAKDSHSGRFFVSAEAATTAVELAALIGLHLGLDPGPNLMRLVVKYFAQQASPSLLVLDNLETPWEPLQSRGAVEELISLLADVNHLALVIAMRGAERPGKVQWTRPFLQPLEPLPHEAALQIFETITDDPDLSDEKTQLLQFTENIPLAVDLMAHLVEYEGLSNVLARLQTEKTNGLSDVELVQSKLPINDILSCKSVPIATSLAYKDNKGRLRLLVPIREHVRQSSPPWEALVQCFRKGFHELLALYRQYNNSCLSSVLAQITANLANLDEVLQSGLQPQSLDLAETIQSVTSLNSFYLFTRGVGTQLLNKIPIHLCSPPQRVLHIIECLQGRPGKIQTQKLLTEGISQFEHIQDPILEGKLYLAAARSYGISGLQIPELEVQLLEKALLLSKPTEDNPSIQCLCLLQIAWLKLNSGDYTAALALGRHAKQLAYQGTNLIAASGALATCTACLSALGDYPNAMIEIREGKELMVLCGMTSIEQHHRSLNLQAEIHLCKSEYAEARRIHITLQESPNSHRYVTALLNIIQIDILIGTKKELVRQNLETASKTCISIHYLRGQTLSGMHLGHLELREGNPTSARAAFQDCLKSNLRKDSEVVIYCLEQLADVAQWPPEFRGQSRWPFLYLCQAHKTKDRLGLSKALLFTADLFLEDDEVTAQSLLTVALEEFTFMDVHRSRAQCMMRLGDLAQKKGKPTDAADLWKSARPLFERSLQAKDVAQIDDRLSALKQEFFAKLTRLHVPITLTVDNSSGRSSRGQEEEKNSQEADRVKAMPV
ncbi:hypothetical protein C8R46DRAFT_1034821 [Mycena filopes]|nr:hypothetical protein C8R46DRAFT_1034821 [Mycena filopes]